MEQITTPPLWINLRYTWCMTLAYNGMNGGYGWHADYVPAGALGQGIFLGVTKAEALRAMTPEAMAQR